MPKKPDQPQETKPELTEWQKRNLEFLQKKQEREEEKKRLEEAERKQAQLQAVADLETEVEKESVERPPAVSKTEEKKLKKSWLKPGVSLKKIVCLKPKKSRKELLRSTGVALLLISSILIFIFSIFMVSPYSKMKVIKVAGLNHAQDSDVKAAANISDSSYFTDLIFNSSQHEKAVVDGNVWVKSAKIVYSFPNIFTIKVKEHEIVAYATTDGIYHPILEDGSLVKEITVESLPEKALVINLTKEGYLKTFLKKMTKLESSLIAEIQTIDLANSSSTSDLLLVTMRDGNSVRVPLSELDQKLPYYDKISKNLVAPAIVDMEVGIYVTNATVEEALETSKAERKDEQETNEDENSEASEGESSETSETEEVTTNSTVEE